MDGSTRQSAGELDDMGVCMCVCVRLILYQGL